MRFAPAVLAVVLALAAAPAARAQTFGRLDDLRTNAAAFFYARPGEATTRVAVWGAVRVPGIYEVTTGTDLSALLSLAGGPVVPPRTSEADQTVTVRLYRAEGTGRRLVRDWTVEAFATSPEAYPALQDGDVVEVEVAIRRRTSWRDTLGVVGSVAAVAAAVTQVLVLAFR